ncbi:MAG TPA: hypothetical protein DCE41_07415, partial [Cytophagales bacterium]|nr:hypothetical protein [Cytophagales bacterium]
GTRFIFDLPEGHVSSRDSEMAETPADFSPPIPVALGAGDWTQLGDLPARLRATPMYKAKVIRTLLQEVPANSPTLAAWKEALLQAASYYHEERYQALLTPMA